MARDIKSLACESKPSSMHHAVNDEQIFGAG
jgi:hypothetical protein